MSHKLVLLAFLLLSLSPTVVNAVQCNKHNGFVCDDESFQFDDTFAHAVDALNP